VAWNPSTREFFAAPADSRSSIGFILRSVFSAPAFTSHFFMPGFAISINGAGTGYSSLVPEERQRAAYLFQCRHEVIRPPA
jgi:hypothetical protein